jgi:hypothetical protein
VGHDRIPLLVARHYRGLWNIPVHSVNHYVSLALVDFLEFLKLQLSEFLRVF